MKMPFCISVFDFNRVLHNRHNNKIEFYVATLMRAAPEVMPPILLYWPTRSGADVGGMVVETEPSC